MSVTAGISALNEGAHRQLAGRSTFARLSVPQGTRFSLIVLRLTLTEFLVVGTVAYAASIFYNRAVLGNLLAIDTYMPAALAIATLVSATTLALRHSSHAVQHRERFLWGGIVASAMAFSAFETILFLLKLAEPYSRGTFICQFCGVAFAMVVVRTAEYSYLRSGIERGTIEARRAIVVGGGEACARVAERMKGSCIHIVGQFELARGQQGHNGEHLREDTRQLVEFARALHADDIIHMGEYEEKEAIAEFARAIAEMPVALHTIPAGGLDFLPSARLSHLGDLVTIQLLHPPLSVSARTIKRMFDLLVSTAALIILAFLLATIAIAIKLDSSGPVLFRQNRHGYNNGPIKVLKFRTMYACAEAGAFRQATRSDPRVTRVGRFLRATNADELPQLINVLRGEMSLVGPRPHAIAHNQMFDGKIVPYSRRHNVKPGITGWAQVNGYRGETDTIEKMQRRIEHDVYYIENWSFFFDLKIIALTLVSRKAYANAG